MPTRSPVLSRTAPGTLVLWARTLRSRHRPPPTRPSAPSLPRSLAPSRSSVRSPLPPRRSSHVFLLCTRRRIDGVTWRSKACDRRHQRCDGVAERAGRTRRRPAPLLRDAPAAEQRQGRPRQELRIVQFSIIGNFYRRRADVGQRPRPVVEKKQRCERRPVAEAWLDGVGLREEDEAATVRVISRIR